MKSVQVKIGKLAAGFALFITLLDTLATLTGMGSNNHTIYEIAAYFSYSILFGVTFLVINRITKIMQIGLLFSIALYMAFSDSSFPAFIVMFLCMSLCYVYGYYKKFLVPKIMVSIFLVFSIFVLCPSHAHNILVALSWTGLFFTFSLMMWYIFSDTLDKAKKESSDERLLEELRRSLVINERLIELTKEMAEKLEGKSQNGIR